jgi:hypothetical protein
MHSQSKSRLDLSGSSLLSNLTLGDTIVNNSQTSDWRVEGCDKKIGSGAHTLRARRGTIGANQKSGLELCGVRCRNHPSNGYAMS